MSLKFNSLLAAAAAAAFALPAGAQVAGVDVGVDADVQAEVQAGAADVGAGVQAEADAGAEARTGGAGEVVLATAADIREGVIVQDPQGGTVGTVEAVEADGAIVSTGNVRAKLPLESFGKNDRGLVISMTRAEFEAAVSAQQAGS